METSVAVPSRRHIWGWIVVAAIVMIAIALGAVLTWRKHMEIDVHSGREREVVELGPWQYSSVDRDTDLSRLALQAGLAPKTPEWRRYLTKGGSARINYRYGGLAPQALRLPEYMKTFGVSQPDQQIFALTAIQCLEQEVRFHVQTDDSQQVLSLCGDAEEIASARMHPR